MESEHVDTIASLRVSLSEAYNRLSDVQAELVRVLEELRQTQIRLVAADNAHIAAVDRLKQAQQAANDWRVAAREFERSRDETLAAAHEWEDRHRAMQQERNALAAELAAAKIDLEQSLPHAERDEAMAPTGHQCDLRKAKQFGPATFVVRRCKLADGHDGMCEPA